jgi:hypothetical protein
MLLNIICSNTLITYVRDNTISLDELCCLCIFLIFHYKSVNLFCVFLVKNIDMFMTCNFAFVSLVSFVKNF